MSGPYAQAAGDYWAASWRGVLPLPPRRKKEPPSGYTGWDGAYPSWPDVQSWIEDRGAGNVCLHLPDGVLGVDVDGYGDKVGAQSLAAAEQRWGPLPATWWSTSREDHVSGIRFYRVPVAAGGTSLAWPGKVGPGIETVHRGHRYAVVAPSIHPDTGRAYRWITPDGVVSTVPPRVADLPELPIAWVVGLTQGREAHTYQGAGMDDGEIRSWLEEHWGGVPCTPMSDAADELLDELHTGAHESLRLLMRLVGMAAVGHGGLREVLGTVRKKFIAEVTSRRDDEATAAEEWTRSLFGAVDKVLGEMAKTGTASSTVDPCDTFDGSFADLIDEAWEEKAAEFDALVSPAPEATKPGTDVLSGSTPGSIEEVSGEPGGETSLDSSPQPGDEPGDEGEYQPRELNDDEIAALKVEQERKAVERELVELRRREKARQLLAAENAPVLRRLSAIAFREAPRPESLVPGVFYRDSLARVYGSPGCGKSFLALDLAMHVALGLDWRGTEVQRGRVFYVMAEGQAVNVLRTEAWCERNGHGFDELEGWFDAFPDALSLTESAIAVFVEECRRDQPALVILDTKNAMMQGEENSASDFAVMRRALDAVRKACGACVVLIDHTGYEGTRARGTSAATAGMDTELFVEKNDDRPPLVTAKVTRDKAAEVGSLWAWHLRMAGEAAALVPLEDYVAGAQEDQRVNDGPLAWQDAHIPTELIDVEGAGKKSVPDLARLMAYDANQRAGDPAGVGMTRADAWRVLKELGHSEVSVRRAWSRLIDMGYLEAAEGVKAAHLRHLWAY